MKTLPAQPKADWQAPVISEITVSSTQSGDSPATETFPTSYGAS